MSAIGDALKGGVDESSVTFWRKLCLAETREGEKLEENHDLAYYQLWLFTRIKQILDANATISNIGKINIEAIKSKQEEIKNEIKGFDELYQRMDAAAQNIEKGGSLSDQPISEQRENFIQIQKKIESALTEYEASCYSSSLQSKLDAASKSIENIHRKLSIGVGSRVLIQNLSSATELNGKVGVVAEEGKDGRWGVRIPGEEESKGIKAENLELVVKPDHDECMKALELWIVFDESFNTEQPAIVEQCLSDPKCVGNDKEFVSLTKIFPRGRKA